MSWEITEIHKFRDERLHLYKQSNCKYWLARFYALGKYKTTSTKETSFISAKSFALDWYDRLRFEQKQGIPIHGRKFLDVVSKFIDYQEVLIASKERTERMAGDYQIRLEGPLSWFNSYTIQEITTKLINEYKEHRLKNGISFNTVKHDFVALRQLLKYSKTQEWIASLPEFPQGKKSKPNPRTWFPPEEWKILLKSSRERIKTARGTRQKWEREQLHDFMIFMVHTGVRVEEALRIRKRDCSIEKKKNKKDSQMLKMELKGKTGIRRVVGTVGSVTAYQRLIQRNEPKPDDLLFPQNHREQLNVLLKETKLKYDKFGRTRNAKSFRSTYIMFRLLHKVPIKDIATNCGTSSDVIDKYYAKHLSADMVAESLSDLPE